MKGLKKYLGIIMGIIMAIAILPSMPAYASGKVVVAVSASTLNIGDTVTVTATAQNDNGEQVSTTLGFQYDSSKLSFVSCSNSAYSGGEGGSVEVSAARATITLKATAAGSASVSVSGSDGLTAGGTKLTVNDTTATASQSGDNSLSSLKITPGTLSPAFQYKTTSYTATVDSNVTEVSVDAKPSNAKATVESITGNTNLKEGANTISIVVKAENGATVTYKIVVTRGGTVQEPQEEVPEEGTVEEDPGVITLNGHDFNLAATIPTDKVPADFTKTTVNCKGQEVEALQFNMGDVVLVYLTTPDTEVKNTLAVYETQSGNIYQFAKIEMGNGYYIILNPPADAEVSEQYVASSVEIGEYGAMAAYGNQEPSLSDFYLVYAISNTGNTGWYQYDKSEGTFQRYVQQTEESSTVDEEAINADMKGLQNSYDKLEKQYTSEKSFARKTIAVLVFIIAVLIVIIVNLFLRRGKDEDEWEDDFKEVPKRFRKKPEEPEEDELEEESPEEKPRRGIFRKKIQEESETEEKKTPEKNVPEKKVPEKKVPEKKAPEKALPEEDDFEVIDLDDL